MELVWASRTTCGESLLSFYPTGPGNRTQVFRLGNSRCLSPVAEPSVSLDPHSNLSRHTVEQNTVKITRGGGKTEVWGTEEKRERKEGGRERWGEVYCLCHQVSDTSNLPSDLTRDTQTKKST